MTERKIIIICFVVFVVAEVLWFVNNCILQRIYGKDWNEREF